MITNKQIAERIESIKIEASHVKQIKKEYSKLQREMEFLTLVRNYIELAPSEEFLLKEKSKLEDLLSKYEQNTADANESTVNYYNGVYNPKKLRLQLKTINYILAD